MGSKGKDKSGKQKNKKQKREHYQFDNVPASLFRCRSFKIVPDYCYYDYQPLHYPGAIRRLGYIEICLSSKDSPKAKINLM